MIDDKLFIKFFQILTKNKKNLLKHKNFYQMESHHEDGKYNNSKIKMIFTK
jgi:hypothetical protein